MAILKFLEQADTVLRIDLGAGQLIVSTTTEIYPLVRNAVAALSANTGLPVSFVSEDAAEIVQSLRQAGRHCSGVLIEQDQYTRTRNEILIVSWQVIGSCASISKHRELAEEIAGYLRPIVGSVRVDCFGITEEQTPCQTTQQ